MQGQGPRERDLELAFSGPSHDGRRAFVNDVRVLGDLEHFILGDLLDLPTILITHLALYRDRVGHYPEPERPRQLLRIEVDISLKPTDGKRGIVAHRREYPSRKGAQREPAGAGIDGERAGTIASRRCSSS